MYHWVEDKEYLKRAYGVCSNIVNQLVQALEKDDIYAEMSIVGSKSRNMVTQNVNNPIDFDFNLEILDAPDFNDCRNLKETIRKAFNVVLNNNGWGDCQDSTSALTTEQRVFNQGNKTPFSIDVCIVCEDGGTWYRLIHKKTGFTYYDQWVWEATKNSQHLYEKVDYIKACPGKWQLVRDRYLKKKNMYLTRNDIHHKSFVCYIEAVNEVYSILKNKNYK